MKCKSIFFVFSFLMGCGTEEAQEPTHISPTDKSAQPNKNEITITQETPSKTTTPHQPGSDASAPQELVKPIWFSISFTHDNSSCSSCFFWFSNNNDKSKNPKLTIEYKLADQIKTLTIEDGLSTTISATHGEHNKHHSIFVQKNPRSDGLFRANLKDIPKGASVLSAKLHLNFKTDQGFLPTDTSSRVTFYEFKYHWDFTTAFKSTETALTYQGNTVRIFELKTDMLDQGWDIKSGGSFDFTDYIKYIISNSK